MSFKCYILGFVLFGSATVRASEGFWLPMQLDEGISYGKSNVPMDAETFKKKYGSLFRSVVSIGPCSGILLGKQGLVLTHYHCAREVLQWNALLATGHLAKTAEQELPAENAPRATLVNRMEDISKAVLSGKRAKSLAERMAAIEARMAKEDVACQKRSRFACRSVEVVPGDLYVQLEEERIDDVRLVYAPPEEQAVASDKPYSATLEQTSAPFALFRLYKNGKPLVSDQAIARVNLKEPAAEIFTIGYPNIYKRYDRVSQLQNAFELGLMLPVSNFLHKMVAYLEKRIKEERELAFKYRADALYLAEWMEHLDGIPRVYEATHKMAARVDFERSFMDDVGHTNPAALASIKRLDDINLFRLSMTRHQSRFENVFLVKSAALGREIMGKIEAAAAINSKWLEKKKKSLDLEIEVNSFLFAFETLMEFPYPTFNTGQALQGVLQAKGLKRADLLRKILSESLVFRDEINDASPEAWKKDSLLVLLNEVAAMQEKSFTFDETIIRDWQASAFTYGSEIAQYMRRSHRPYYPNIGMVLPGYGFGRIRSGQSLERKFDTDIDCGSRNLRGSAVFDFRGSLVGMFVDANPSSTHDVDYSYDTQQTQCINLSLRSIVEHLDKAGASAIAADLGSR